MSTPPEPRPRAQQATVAIGALALLAAGLVGGYVVRSGTEDPTLASVASTASATDHDAADVRFVQQMVPHHTQATEMAGLAETRAGSDDVRELAARIAAAQGPEIATMTGWLDAWGEEPSSSDMSGMDGMVSEPDLTDLAALAGADFDRRFLTLMIDHHTGAVAMADEELEQGQDAGTLGLAAQVAITQTAEVARMKELLS